MNNKDDLNKMLMSCPILRPSGASLSLALEVGDLRGNLADYKKETVKSILLLINEIPVESNFLEGIIRLIFASNTKEEIMAYYKKFIEKYQKGKTL